MTQNGNHDLVQGQGEGVLYTEKGKESHYASVLSRKTLNRNLFRAFNLGPSSLNTRLRMSRFGTKTRTERKRKHSRNAAF